MSGLSPNCERRVWALLRSHGVALGFPMQWQCIDGQPAGWQHAPVRGLPYIGRLSDAVLGAIGVALSVLTFGRALRQAMRFR
jgi:hypothetical protein